MFFSIKSVINTLNIPKLILTTSKLSPRDNDTTVIKINRKHTLRVPIRMTAKATLLAICRVGGRERLPLPIAHCGQAGSE